MYRSIFTLVFLIVTVRSSVPAQDSDLVKDTERLYNATKGHGTDEDSLIDVLTHRDYPTRLAIVREYRLRYDRDLWSDIKDDTSGDFRAALKPLVMRQAEFLVQEFNHHLANVDDLINLVMLAVSDDDQTLLKELRDTYLESYNITLKESVTQATNVRLGRFLVNLLNRAVVNGSLNDNQTRVDYNTLKLHLSAGDVDSALQLLTQRSLPAVGAILQLYNEIHTKEEEMALDAVLKANVGHDEGLAITAFFALAEDQSKYLAQELYKSMKILGTDEDLLTRIICTRADKDLDLVKVKYQEITGVSLKQKVEEETSGDYRKVLLNLIN